MSDRDGQETPRRPIAPAAYLDLWERSASLRCTRGPLLPARRAEPPAE